MTDSPTITYQNWLKENGAKFNKIELKADSDGLGCVYTAETVKENESFASIPFKLCITEHVARKALPNLQQFSGRVVLCLFLLLQKQLGERSFYAPYINMLPKIIKTPMTFDEQDLKFIENTNLESVTRERKAALLNDFNQLLEHLPEGVSKNDVSWDDFLWCYACYSSRSFPYQLIDPSSTQVSEVLFPLLDALNHKPGAKITWSRNGDIETGSLSFIAGQEYSLGDEIYNNYGPKSNEELLLGYGFCFEHNEHDHISLKPNFSRDPNYEIKLNILKECKVLSGNTDQLVFYIHRDNIPAEFFKLMRVLVMNGIETQHYSVCADAELLDFVGYRNELSMLSMTLAILKSRSQALKTHRFVVDDSLTYTQKCALMYRSGQEEIFNTTLSKVEEMKRNLIQKMNQDITEHRIAPLAPFLSIVNPEYQHASIDIDSNSPFITLDNVVITLKRLLNKNPEFSNVISELFEDLEEEADIIMMLSLIKENSNSNSEWRHFFDKLSAIKSSNQEEEQEELEEMYNSMIPAFAEEYPEIFDMNVFTLEAFVWADNILNSYSIDNPLAIVPL